MHGQKVEDESQLARSHKHTGLHQNATIIKHWDVILNDQRLELKIKIQLEVIHKMTSQWDLGRTQKTTEWENKLVLDF